MPNIFDIDFSIISEFIFSVEEKAEIVSFFSVKQESVVVTTFSDEKGHNNYVFSDNENDKNGNKRFHVRCESDAGEYRDLSRRFNNFLNDELSKSPETSSEPESN